MGVVEIRTGKCQVDEGEGKAISGNVWGVIFKGYILSAKLGKLSQNLNR